MLIATTETLLRLGASVAFGAAIGYERERLGRPAGLRTHLLVALASATFMLVSTQFVYFQAYGKDDLVMVDTSRIAASVVSGVGFLGAGAILRTGIGVQGLTTAASLWMTASVGLAAGSGMYTVATAATLCTLVCLTLLRRLEGHPSQQLARQVVVVVDGDPGPAQAILARLGEHGAADLDLDRNLRTNRTRLTADLRLANQAALEQMLADLGTAAGVRRVQVHRLG